VDKATYEEALAEAKSICDEDHERVVEAGGLHIIGTERHESRRIDNQLRGRAGRQGDPGSSRFYLSLDDELMKRFASERVAGLMERMGLEDDVAIESRIVSKTIEGAQSRVEGFNFDIRKRVVEFDDVINKQRETIYAERDKVLRNEDLGETVLAFLDEEVEAVLDTFAASEAPVEWNVEGLALALRAMGLDGPGTSEHDLEQVQGKDELLGHLREVVDARLHEKEAEVGEADWSLVERLVVLRTIDSLWVEHLTEIDDMRRGIGLRGYAQQDPLNEFRKEAYSLYEELRALIRHQVATSIFRVEVNRSPAPSAAEEQLTADLAAGAAAVRAGSAAAAAASGVQRGASMAGGTATATGFGATAGATVGSAPGGARARGLPSGPDMRGMVESLGDRPAVSQGGSSGNGPLRNGFTPSGARIGRNDPCFCGSGLKYKKCHGR
jgi:preprotein translocase subunit SecA